VPRILMLRVPLLAVLLGLAMLTARLAAAQAPVEHTAPWTFTTRLLATGSSDKSEPDGYKAFSAVTLEAALRRNFGRILGLELMARTESREVDSLVPSGEDRRLGSLELLPLSLMLQFHPASHGAVRPYAGAGVNLTVAWEKSGALDSLDMGGSVGPALQAGADFDLSSRTLLNVDLRWNRLTADLENAGARLTRLKLDPLSLGVGLGFRF
jgi:outer membrane protein